jgi:hypothetical protein
VPAQVLDVRSAHVMRLHHLTSPRRISLSWLIWLALLLPLAQSVAAWHSAGHGVAEASSQDDVRKAVSSAEHCDLCLTAASLSGSAPAADRPTLVLHTGTQSTPVDAPTSVWLAPTLTAYSSRAPPPPSR